MTPPFDICLCAVSALEYCRTSQTENRKTYKYFSSIPKKLVNNGEEIQVTLSDTLEETLVKICVEMFTKYHEISCIRMTRAEFPYNCQIVSHFKALYYYRTGEYKELLKACNSIISREFFLFAATNEKFHSPRDKFYVPVLFSFQMFLLLPASSAACRASITFIRCMCITCTCIHLKQAGLLQQLARRYLRHSHSAATVSVACRCQTRYEKTKVRSDLRNHPRQASLAACSTTNRLQVGCSGLQVPAQSGSSSPDGDGTVRVTHSRTAYASFISSRRCYRAEDRECSVGSSRFLERWTLTLEQSSN